VRDKRHSLFGGRSEGGETGIKREKNDGSGQLSRGQQTDSSPLYHKRRRIRCGSLSESSWNRSRKKKGLKGGGGGGGGWCGGASIFYNMSEALRKKQTSTT